MKKTNPQNSGLSRRDFLKVSAATAATIGLGELFIPNDANAKPKSTYQRLEENFAKSNFKEINIYASTQEDIGGIKKTLQYLEDMPAKLQHEFGIKYNEPTHILDNFKKSGFPIVSSRNLQGIAEGTHAIFSTNSRHKQPLIIADANFITENSKEPSARSVFHEMIHSNQFINNVLAPANHSTEDIKRIILEAERLVSADEAEFLALAEMLRIKEANNDLSLPEVIDKSTEFIKGNINNLSYPISVTSINATVAALETIKEKGINAINNLDAKKAAFSTCSEFGDGAEKLASNYKPLVEKFAAEYKKIDFPEAGDVYNQDLTDVIYDMHHLDSRGAMYQINDNHFPLNAVNDDIFEEIILEKTFLQRMFTENQNGIKAQTLKTAASKQTISPTEKPIKNAFAFAERFIKEKTKNS